MTADTFECKWCGNDHKDTNCPFKEIPERLQKVEQKLDEIVTALITEEGETL